MSDDLQCKLQPSLQLFLYFLSERKYANEIHHSGSDFLLSRERVKRGEDRKEEKRESKRERKRERKRWKLNYGNVYVEKIKFDFLHGRGYRSKVQYSIHTCYAMYASEYVCVP